MSSQSDAGVNDHFVRPKVVGAMGDGVEEADGHDQGEGAMVDMDSESCSRKRGGISLKKSPPLLLKRGECR